MARNNIPLGILAAAICLLTLSCSTAPSPGSAPFHWDAAKETFLSGDYRKTSENLEKLAGMKSEFNGRIRPWRLIVLSGMVQANAEFADQFEQGARANKANPTPFRREMDESRALAARLALTFGEAYAEFQRVQPEGAATLDFPFPARGNLSLPSQIARITAGSVYSSQELEVVRSAMIQRGVIQAACQAVGATDDMARARELFKSPPIQIERPTFEAGIAHGLYAAATLFGRDKRARPEQQKFFHDQLVNIAKLNPSAPKLKDWISSLAKELKAAGM